MRAVACDRIAGIILAAGEGRRFGQCKATADLDGTSFLEVISNRLKEIKCEPIVVVGGRDAETIATEASRLAIGHAINSDWEKGQFSSLKVGLSKIKDDICGALITLVDHPFVAAETYKSLKEAFVKYPKRILIPVYEHRRGHPIIIPGEIMNQIIIAPDDINLRDIIKNHESMVVQFRCEDSGVIKDIDTRDDLERARNS